MIQFLTSHEKHNESYTPLYTQKVVHRGIYAPFEDNKTSTRDLGYNF